MLPIFAIALFALGCFFHPALLAAAVLLGVRAAGYALDLQQQRVPLSCIIYWGLGAALYSAALVVSAQKYSAGSVDWKGRTYPVRP